MKKPKVDFDDYTGNYNELLRESTDFFSPSEEYFARYKVDILRKQVPEGARRILEYGCGIGRNIPFLREAFPDAQILGSDISAASLEIARQSNPGVDFFLEQVNGNDQGTFDVIFVAGVFHHIPPRERPAAMSMLYRRLSPGGVVVIFEHNPYNPVTRRIVNTCPYDEDAVLLRPVTLRGLLSGASLRMEKSEYCLFIPPSLSALLPLESKLGWLPLGGQYWVKAIKLP
jgi:SAM-dependent methyltransferase